MLKQLMHEMLAGAVSEDELRSAQVVPICSRRDERGTDLFLIFVPPYEHPSHVVKMTRDPAQNFKIDGEHLALSTLHPLAKLSRFVPRSLRRGRFKGRAFVVSQGVRGRVLANLIRETPRVADAYDLLRQAMRVLLRIGKAPVPDGVRIASPQNCLTPEEKPRLADVEPALSPRAARTCPWLTRNAISEKTALVATATCTESSVGSNQKTDHAIKVISDRGNTNRQK